mgnify:CR=1 FL=1
MKNNNEHLKKLTPKESKQLTKQAQQFIMQRIRDMEIIQGRNLHVEPILIEELEYYVVRSWLMDKSQMTFDLFYTKMRVDEENIGD